jgi:hypothetical protein
MPTSYMSTKPSSIGRLVLFFVCVTLSGLLSLSVSAKSLDRFESSIRVGYVPHPSFSVDNGIASGVLSKVIECSTAYFPQIEFVEMSSYSRMLQSLESNVIDIALNMARTKQRDQVASYAMDLYESRVLLVGNDKSSNNQGAGVLAVKQGSDLDTLLLTKGYQVNTQAYSIYRLIEMYRQEMINSFVETEIAILPELQAMDDDGIDFDYEVLAQFSGGAYVANDFFKGNPKAIKKWKKVAKACAYLAPKIDS